MEEKLFDYLRRRASRWKVPVTIRPLDTASISRVHRMAGLRPYDFEVSNPVRPEYLIRAVRAFLQKEGLEAVGLYGSDDHFLLKRSGQACGSLAIRFDPREGREFAFLSLFVELFPTGEPRE